jgi:small subunit ribosomal protein S10
MSLIRSSLPLSVPSLSRSFSFYSSNFARRRRSADSTFLVPIGASSQPNSTPRGPSPRTALLSKCASIDSSTGLISYSAPSSRVDYFLSVPEFHERFAFKVRHYHPKLLQRALEAFELTANKLRLYLTAIIPLPKHIKRYTFLRSPHVDKTSREQYEIRTHTRLVTIEVEDNDPNSQERIRLVKNCHELIGRVHNVAHGNVRYSAFFPANTSIQSATFIDSDQVMEDEDADKNYTKTRHQLLEEMLARRSPETAASLQSELPELLSQMQRMKNQQEQKMKNFHELNQEENENEEEDVEEDEDEDEDDEPEQLPKKKFFRK